MNVGHMIVESIKMPLNDAPELCRLDAATLVEGYQSRQLSPVEVTRAAIERAEAINPATNAFTFLDHDGAMDTAKASDLVG